MRPDASENSQTSPSTIVRAARAAGSHPHLASVLLQGRRSGNIHASSGVIRGIPDEMGKRLTESPKFVSMGTDAGQRLMTIKYSDESGEKAKNSWARQATTVVLINVAVLASLLFAMEVGFRLFRPGYEFYSRTQP